MAIVNDITKGENELMDILSLLFNLGYQETDGKEYITEVLSDNTDVQEIGKEFFEQIKFIAYEEVNKIANPITMIVEGVALDGTLTLKRLDGGDSWTGVTNPTIFNHLSKGDEVVVGFHNGQTSNCYVLFAKVTGQEYKEKSIIKDISKIKDLNTDTLILKKWMNIFVQQVFPDIEITDKEGNIIDTKPHPKRIEFNEDMKKWIDIKIEGV